MIQYYENGDYAIFNDLVFRKDKRTGYYLNAKTHKRLHVYVWEYYNGKIPKGYHVHHKDFDKNNNELENLVLLTSQEHLKLHGDSWDKDRYDKQMQILKEKATPKAAEWHKTEAGAEWHKAHYEKTKAGLHQKADFVCKYCGKPFVAEITGQNKFCSPNCKAAYRRKLGVDNEKRICAICGREFVTNKYSKARTCSRECRILLKRNKSNTQD